MAAQSFKSHYHRLERWLAQSFTAQWYSTIGLRDSMVVCKVHVYDLWQSSRAGIEVFTQDCCNKRKQNNKREQTC